MTRRVTSPTVGSSLINKTAQPRTTKTMSAKKRNMATEIPAGKGFGRPVVPAGCCLLERKLNS